MDKFGLSDRDYQFIKEVLLQVLKDKMDVKIRVFGSRARGDFKKYSDLDLWIESNPMLSSEEIFQLNEEFEESDLAITIDIVTPETVFEDYLPAIQKELVDF